jgi:hypothetical protein
MQRFGKIVVVRPLGIGKCMDLAIYVVIQYGYTAPLAIGKCS